MTSMQASGLVRNRGRTDDDETRQKMLQVAADFIRQEGLTVSLDHLSYEMIIQVAAVPRSAAYRLWKKKDDFFVELLREVATRRWQGVPEYNESVVQSALEAAMEHNPDLDTVSGRKQALFNALRVGIQHELEHLVHSNEWQTFVSLSATVLSLPDGDLKTRLLEDITDSDSEFIARVADFYAGLGWLVGFRIKDEFKGDFAAMASVTTAIVEGFALRSVGTPQLRDNFYHLDAFKVGQAVDWSMPALACISAIDLLIEEDPNYIAGGDLMKNVVEYISERNLARRALTAPAQAQLSN